MYLVVSFMLVKGQRPKRRTIKASATLSIIIIIIKPGSVSYFFVFALNYHCVRVILALRDFDHCFANENNKTFLIKTFVNLYNLLKPLFSLIFVLLLFPHTQLHIVYSGLGGFKIGSFLEPEYIWVISVLLVLYFCYTKRYY